MSERRNYPRLNQKINVQVVSSSSGRDKTVSSSKNVSHNGLCFFSPESVAVGSYITMKLTMPIVSHEIEVKVEGTVKRCGKSGDQYEIAVELTDVNTQFDSWIADALVKGLKEGKAGKPETEEDDHRYAL